MANNSYFNLFEDITFKNIDIKNIFDSIRLEIDKLEDNNLINYYRIKDGETPDKIAFKFYNDKKLYWLVLLVNEMYDYFYDFPLSDKELKLYMDTYYIQNDTLITEQALKILQTGESLEEAKETIKDQIYQNFYDENDGKKNIKIVKSEYIDSLLEAIRNRE